MALKYVTKNSILNNFFPYMFLPLAFTLQVMHESVLGRIYRVSNVWDRFDLIRIRFR